MITDSQYELFLAKLVTDQMGKNPLTISEWEQRFLSSFSQRVRRFGWITEGRRASVDRMWMRYGPELGLPHPLDTVSPRPAIAPADSDGCEYLERSPDGRQQRCNAPAEWQGEITHRRMVG